MVVPGPQPARVWPDLQTVPVRNDRHAGPPHHLVRSTVTCIYQEETGSGRDMEFELPCQRREQPIQRFSSFLSPPVPSWGLCFSLPLLSLFSLPFLSFFLSPSLLPSFDPSPLLFPLLPSFFLYFKIFRSFTRVAIAHLLVLETLSQIRQCLFHFVNLGLISYLESIGSWMT